MTFDGDVFVGTIDHDGNFKENPKRPKVEDMGDGNKRVSIQGAADDRRIYEQMDTQRKRFNHILGEERNDELLRGIASQDITIDWGRIRKALVKSYMALAYHVGIDPFICNRRYPSCEMRRHPSWEMKWKVSSFWNPRGLWCMNVLLGTITLL